MKNKNHNILYRTVAKIMNAYVERNFQIVLNLIILGGFIIWDVIWSIILDDPQKKLTEGLLLFIVVMFVNLGFYCFVNCLIYGGEDFSLDSENKENKSSSKKRTVFTDSKQITMEKNYEAAKYCYPVIEEKIEEIDKKLEDGYVFSGMITGKWENTYKQEIFGLMRSEYEISDENQQKILRLLDRMNNNMVNQKEKEAELQVEVNIEAMERIADMDLVDNSDFLVTK